LEDEGFDAIFTSDDGDNPLDTAREDRIANLRDLGTQLRNDWDGTFLNVALASNGSTVEFVRLSSRFRAFDDPLFKLTMVNAIMHSGSGTYSFRDHLLPAVDYHLLRHALRQGLVRPDGDMLSKLENSQQLAHEEASQLRRATLIALILVSDRAGVEGELLDNLYWTNRVNCKDTPVCVDSETAPRCPFLQGCERRTSFPLPLEITRYY
jgi:hypothetical protein